MPYTLSCTLVVAALTLCAGCFEDEPPNVSKSAFPSAMAQAACEWLFACCDQAERPSLPGGTQDEASCVTELGSSFAATFQTADEKMWRGEEAAALVDAVRQAATACPRSFDPAYEISLEPPVTPTLTAGGRCSNTWECDTHYCVKPSADQLGVCATPLPEGSACTPTEPCEEGLRCIADKCGALQVDGAACTSGSECISGACGGGKCVVSATYTCDGK